MVPSSLKNKLGEREIPNIIVKVVTFLVVAFIVSASLFGIQRVESSLENPITNGSGQVSAYENLVSKQLGQMSTLDRLEADYESGKISISQYMLYKAWRVFDSGKVPTEYALPSEETQLYSRSATMVIQEIKKSWNNLNPETQNELEFVFKRPTDDGGGFDDKKHLLPKLYNTTNFIIHWTNGTDAGSGADAVPLTDANTNGVPDYIEDFAAIFENVRSFEVDNRGFHAPPDDAAEPNDANRRNPDYRYDIFVYNMTPYGYVHREQSSSPSYSFMGVDNDYLGFSTPQLQAMQVTAAHEFCHAIQYYYDCTEEGWWMEATSTYMEDEVYPDANDNYQYLPDWFENCDFLGLEWFDGSHEYGNFIFAKRLSEDFGDDVIREIWEEMVVNDGIVAIDNVLRRRGSSFVDEFSKFTIANLFLEDKYVDGVDYREILRWARSVGYIHFDGVFLEYEYDASLEPDYTVIDNNNVHWKAWMDIWATDYVTIRLAPTVEKYRIFFDGLDPTTDYLVSMAWKKDGAVASGRFSLDAEKDSYVDWPYDPTVENLTLIISNVGYTATTDPSWRVIITKLLPQLELGYDDGTSEIPGSGNGPEVKFAVRFTPTTSGRLTECSYFIVGNLAPVKVHVMDKSGNDVITPFLKTPSHDRWDHVDLSSFQVPVSSGVDFYIAIEWMVPNAPTVGIDVSDPDGRSYDYDGEKWWQIIDADFMIRVIVVTETPDLTFISISRNPSVPIEGSPVTFNVNIFNRGPVSAASFKVSYSIDGSKIGEWTISGLLARKNITKSFTWTAVLGNHTVEIFADSGNNVYEQVEANNELKWAFQVAPKPRPDLIIRDISWTPETPAGGNTVTFTVTIKNNGTANAGAFKTAYYINTTKLGEWSIPSLSVGQEANKTFTWTYVEGSHVVKAIADSNGEISEEDETNNEREEIIGNLPPKASFTCNGRDCLSSPIAYVRKSTYFNATESYDPDGSIVSFSWDFGDGNVTTVTDPIITHNYTLIGNCKVTLNVTDNMGMWHTATGDVTVKLKCDLNNDNVVNVVDITVVSVAFSSRLGDPNWNPNVDFDNDGRITIIDITVVTIEFGSKA